MKTYISESFLLNIIKKEGVDKILFNVPMRPLHTELGFVSFITSSDDAITLPCKINTERYDPMEGYKITVECLVKGYGTEHFYLTDFVQLLNKGIVEIRGYKFV